jgi:hypothetical protein
VGDAGEVHVAPLEDAARPSRRVWSWWAGAVALNMASAGTAAAGFMLGGRLLGAAMGLVVIGTAPLLAVAPTMMLLQRRRLHRRLHRRPDTFGRR